MVNTATKLFIQHCLGERCVEEAKLKEIYKRCFNLNRVISGEDWTEGIASVNAALFPFSLELRSGVDEESSKLFYALVNTLEDEVSQQASDYIPSQLTYLDKLTEAIITAPGETFFITTIDALNLQMTANEQNADDENVPTTQLTANNLTKTERADFIDTFADDGWLSKTRLGYLTIGVRAILELKFKLKGQYEGYLFDCSLCEAPITQGLKCDTEGCEGRFHEFCLSKTKRGSTRCPACKINWTPRRIGPPQNEEDVEFNGKYNSSPEVSSDEQQSAPSRRVKREMTENNLSPPTRSRRRRA